MTHIWVSKLNIIGSDNGLSPDRCQVIIGTSAGILLIWPLATNFSDELIEICIQQNAFENVVCEMASILSRPQCVNSGTEWHLNMCVRMCVCACVRMCWWSVPSFVQKPMMTYNQREPKNKSLGKYDVFIKKNCFWECRPDKVILFPGIVPTTRIQLCAWWWRKTVR